MSDKNYYVVEFRLPKTVDSASDPKAAYEKARNELESETGFSLSAWYARVFEYQPGEPGPIAEYFANPAGTQFREIKQNHEEHNEKYK